MAIKGEFNLGRIAYLLKNNFASTSINTSTSTIATPISTLLAINPTLLTIPPIQPILLAQQNQSPINQLITIELSKQNQN